MNNIMGSVVPDFRNKMIDWWVETSSEDVSRADTIRLHGSLRFDELCIRVSKATENKFIQEVGWWVRDSEPVYYDAYDNCYAIPARLVIPTVRDTQTKT